MFSKLAHYGQGLDDRFPPTPVAESPEKMGNGGKIGTRYKKAVLRLTQAIAPLKILSIVKKISKQTPKSRTHIDKY